ncbi:MAG: NUDIX domain-containing protein [Endomicrobiales bacterium]
MKLEERLYKRHRVFAGRAVNFSADEIILPDGRKATREYMDHPGAVAVLPFIDEKNIVLVKQYRFPVREATYELPAGKLDRGENPLACVRRELLEETGYRAGTVKKMLSFWPTPAFSNEVIYIFSATSLTVSVKSPDEDEFIETRTVPFRQALEWVRKGRIRDSKTVIGLLFWAGRE